MGTPVTIWMIWMIQYEVKMMMNPTSAPVMIFLPSCCLSALPALETRMNPPATIMKKMMRPAAI